ncbi:aldehyde ferredoxin oxidoreductase C-terminal domain-containing protein [Pelosinus sp. IPA-1]|uniref:aldehyde ferredoxin oxidoreductase family protein n=1 Tax=Pelosinus sp. IPA-1 TaxID=3029569 RepID=UPI0024362716|nr:aldehyde ferredoxin oxidoreductase C-terminal domain-containing protein [Pelosinus sp. IPA-1]GMB01576.1 aldehyde ferredoxin oxidoreductase [Pelosinus sp. IPA-1]
MFYRINMADLSVKKDDGAPYQGLGGRALSSRIIDTEVSPTDHALGEGNKLVFVTGLLSGTGAPNAGRMSLGAKSPLTGGIKESNVGGAMGHKLGRLGIRGIIVEGLPKKDISYIIRVCSEGLFLEEMPELKGLDIYDTVAKLQEKFGAKIAIGCIGTAGERKMATACVGFTDMEGDPTRQAGRGGMGAVMGSKGIKAIIADDSGTKMVPFVDEPAFRAGAKKLANALLTHPVTSQALPAYGTDVLVNILSEAGGLPTRNFSSGRFEGANNIGGETLAATIHERGGKTGHGCSPGCIIRCSQIYKDKKGEVLTGGFEYESCWSFGAHLGVDNLDDIALMNRLCDDYGVDSIDTGVAIGVAMEAGYIKFGDSQAAIDLIHELGKATPIGRILGAGAEITGKVFGVRRVPTVKGQAIPAYDPRAVKGVGVTYATTTMGADHTAGYSVTANILGVGGKVDPLKPEGQVELSRNLQIATAFIDSTGLCLFVAFAILDIPEGLEGIVEMCNARYGWDKTIGDYLEMGKQVLREERAFNASAGIGGGADDLPDFFRKELLPPHNVAFDVPKAELDTVFNF